MAITKPNLTRIWAATAAGGDVVDPDVQTPGKFSLGWGAEKPPYQFFNFMQKLFTQGLGYFDEQGIGFWNTYTDYQDLSLSKGSNGVVYLLKTSGDGTQNPVSDGGTNWTVVAGKQSVTGSTVFTQSTNNIALTGIGSIGLEIGDVVRVSGTADNNGLFTAEVLTDSGNMIFNQAHAGGTTSKSFVDETVSATVTLIAKFYNAAKGLGQGAVNVTSSREKNVSYTNSTNRALSVSVYLNNTVAGGNWRALIEVPNVSLASSSGVDSASSTTEPVESLFAEIPVDSAYILNIIGGGATNATVNFWTEIR